MLQFRHLRSQCTFPWLLANVLDPALGDDVSLGNCEKTKILESSNGIKIGLIGLAEREWYVFYFFNPSQGGQAAGDCSGESPFCLIHDLLFRFRGSIDLSKEQCVRYMSDHLQAGHD